MFAFSCIFIFLCISYIFVSYIRLFCERQEQIIIRNGKRLPASCCWWLCISSFAVFSQNSKSFTLEVSDGKDICKYLTKFLNKTFEQTFCFGQNFIYVIKLRYPSSLYPDSIHQTTVHKYIYILYTLVNVHKHTQPSQTHSVIPETSHLFVSNFNHVQRCSFAYMFINIWIHKEPAYNMCKRSKLCWF